MSAPDWLITVPIATIAIMVITFVISLVLQSTNRLVISRFLGWDNYRSIQKELAAFRKEQMDAARSNDKKQLEKVKKRQSQINALNAKVMKPQMIQMVISFCALPLFFFINGLFGETKIGDVAGVAVIPHFGPLPYFVWYMMASFFMGALLMRLLGTALNT